MSAHFIIIAYFELHKISNKAVQMSGNLNESAGQAGKKEGKMSRSEAIMKMGAVAGGTIMNGIMKENTGYIPDVAAEKALKNPVLAKAISSLEYLTPADKFIVQRRGTPVLSEIPSTKLAALGLSRETWKLEIVADAQSNSEIGNPLTIGNGNAFGWNDLMKLAENRAVRYLHALTCTNSPRLYGMGLWEGVPLRDVFWQTEPKQNIRRIFFNGYHNDDPKQVFYGSLPISRVLEEAPGELPVILCYKLNGKYLSHAIGGPVRLFVPGFYSNRSIKWLQKITVTNSFHANDTYAEGNNDVESPVKSYSKFIQVPEKVKPGIEFALTGYAQVGASGIDKVQYLVRSSDHVSESDPDGVNEKWLDAIVLPPPSTWGSDLPGDRLPDNLQFDPQTGKPYSWPLINTIVHWAALTKVSSRGDFEVRCRTIDSKGIAQPMPRPFGRSGFNRIDIRKFNSE